MQINDSDTPSNVDNFETEETKTWRMPSLKTALLAGGIGFQLLLLVSMTAMELVPHVRGETILVRTAPVDPRDLFRGDYVILNYEFSRLPHYAEMGHGTPGQTVYVTMAPEPDGKHWFGVKYSDIKPNSGIFLKGTLVKGDRIEYGIESYFVQEGKGKEYEQAIRAGNLSAEIAVDPSGKSALKGLVFGR